MTPKPHSFHQMLRHPRQHFGQLCRFGAIGATVLAGAAGFAYTAGWLTPHRLTAQRIVNAFEANAGEHPGFRRNHAKGVCVAGYFEGNGAALAVSRASVFGPTRTPVIGRFAIPGGNPAAADNSVPIRSMALDFSLAHGEQWRTAMNNTPVFVVNTPLAFFQQLLASRPDLSTGKPDPARLHAFYAAHPETQPFLNWVKTHPPSSSFANGTYYSINAFRAIDANGNTHFIRWAMQPETPYTGVTAAQAAGHDFLGDELVQRLMQGPLRWHLILTVAAPGDPTTDATRAWPDGRQQIDAGTLVIERERAQSDGDCRDINYDPTVLPVGLEPSDDPLLAARSAAYAVSFNRRTHEQAVLTSVGHTSTQVSP